MAKPTVKKVPVKLIRSIYIDGSLVTATQPGKGKDAKPEPTIVDVPASLAAELISNSKAVAVDTKEKANFSVAERVEDDDFADV